MVMKRPKSHKELIEARQLNLRNASRSQNNFVSNSDTEISTKSTSVIFSSLYLLTLAVIVALAFIFGFVSLVYADNHKHKPAEGFGIQNRRCDEKVNFQNDDGIVQSNDDDDVRESDENYDCGDNDAQLPYTDDDDDEAELHLESESDYAEQKYNISPKKSSKKYKPKPVLYWENRDLLHDYKFSFEKALKIREANMKKYSYPYLTDGVDKRSNLSLQEFYDVYDGKWPVIVTDVIKTWPASTWSEKSMKAKYGDARVGMVSFHKESSGGKEAFSVPLGLFLDHINMSSPNTWTYVQDEIFLMQFPELRAHVLDTIYGKEDFFNLFPKSIRPWDCFFLWGTAHSRSSLHVDPYNWTGTNAIIFGHKKWKLVIPGQDKHLGIYPGSFCGFPLDCHKFNSKYDTYSNTDQIKRKLKKIKYLEVDHRTGEMLFLPTGWFHQAYNVVPTLAVSGEIMNRNNYLAILEEIFDIGALHRSILPDNVETLSPEHLVEFVMSKIPAKILKDGEDWTDMNIRSMHNKSQDSSYHRDYL